jgi:DNA-binding HxlR family transcriptional regulator
VGLVAGKWELAVLAALADGPPLRQAAIRRRIGGVSLKVLSQTLRRMQDSGLIARTVIDAAAPDAEPPPSGPAVSGSAPSGVCVGFGLPAMGYVLTPAGRELLPVLTGLGSWLDHHRGHLGVARPVDGIATGP